MIERANWLKGSVFIAVLICLVVAVGGGSVWAQDATTPKTSLDAQQVFTKASPAVVKIRIYSRTGKALSTGSGFFIDATGTIITNYHVIEDAGSVRVDIQKKPSLVVTKIIALDKQGDLAIIKVDGKNLPFLKLSEALPKVGEKVFAIGSPHGLTNTLSDGLVSGLRLQGKMTLIQTSAPISHGSSGGPLLSSKGVVLGVTTSGIIKGENLGFVVPAERVTRLIKNPNAASQVSPKLVMPPEPGGETKVYDSIAAFFREAPKGSLPRPSRCKHGLRVRKWENLSIGLFNKWCESNVVGSKLSLTFEWSGKNDMKVNKDAIYSGVRPTIQYDQIAYFIRQCRVYYTSGRTKIVRHNVIVTSGLNIRSLWCNVAFPLSAGNSLLKIRPGTKLKAHATINAVRLHGGTRGGTLMLHLILKDARVDRDSLDHALGIRKSSIKTRPERKPTTRPKRTDEDEARSQLALAKSYIAAGLRTKAVDILKEAIKKYPETQAAKEARAELEKLGKR